jgi:hypothetical protein
MLFSQRIRENGNFYTIFEKIFVYSVTMTKFLSFAKSEKVSFVSILATMTQGRYREMFDVVR